MGLNQSFHPLELDTLLDTCREYKEKGYRLAQIHPVLKQDNSISLFYTFVKDDEMINFEVSGIEKGVTEVPSVTKLFIAAFVFENEAAELFGVNVVGNVLDFQGAFYSFGEGVEAPMTIISPEQLAAREKAAKIAKAKAAKAAKAAKEAQAAKAGSEKAESEPSSAPQTNDQDATQEGE